MGIGEIWNLIILSPMINILVVLSNILFSNLGLAIILLTIVIRALMYPLTMKQLKASKAMQSIQTQVAELRKKYAKDRQQLAQEQMKLYKQAGMNPAGCLLPMLIQMPIWIALYQAITKVLAVGPEDFLSLSGHLYSIWPNSLTQVPLVSNFLWLDLGTPDKWLILPILVGGTMWVQQKMVTMPSADPRQQAQSQMMVWTMPLMFAFLTITFPSGLALYWITSNVISIVMQYFVTGWGGLRPSPAAKKAAADKKVKEQVTQPKAPILPPVKPSEAAKRAEAIAAEPAPAPEEEARSEKSGIQREDRGRSYSPGTRPTRRKQGGGRDQRRKRR